MNMRDGGTKAQNYFWPMYMECSRLDKPWAGWASPEDHTSALFPATSRGRAEVILHCLKYQAMKDAQIALTFECGAATLEIQMYKTRRGERWYTQRVQATRPVDGRWYVNPFEVRGSVVVVEPTIALPTKEEYAAWVRSHAAKIPEETWQVWATRAGREPYTTQERQALVCLAIDEGHDGCEYYSHCRRFADDEFSPLQIEIHIIRSALDDVIAADVLEHGWFQD